MLKPFLLAFVAWLAFRGLRSLFGPLGPGPLGGGRPKDGLGGSSGGVKDVPESEYRWKQKNGGRDGER
ncbi:MAG: hypothetical protein ACI9EF_000991 [Pseudohongiellaceae bacterium]|jgi:hypothetical protein